MTEIPPAKIDVVVGERKTTGIPVLLAVKCALKGFFALPQIILLQLKTAPDSNRIHSDNKSSGRNFVNYYFEQDSGDAASLLQKIKTIKAMESGITFQDVVCASLSATLFKYFASGNRDSLTPPPSIITVGNAVQLGQTRTLTNNCAYNFERIPLGPPPQSRVDLLAALREIRKSRSEAAQLQQANYMIIRGCSLLPERYLRRLLEKSRCSLGLSNIPGPSNLRLGDSQFSMRHLTFWTPNRFKTRLGLSVFSLKDKLHIGLGGDRGSIEEDKDVESILKWLVEEINRMYEIVRA